MGMRFGDISGISLEVFILGKSLESRKNIRSNAFYSQGVPIRPKNMTWASYIVKTQEVIYMEEDKSKDCKNYPNSEFQSWGDCEDQGSREVLANRFPNIIPVWLKDNIENVTTRAVIEDGKGRGQKKNCEKAVRLTAWVDPPLPSPEAVRKM